MNSMKRQKERTLKDELPRSVGAQYATGDQWRNNSRKNDGMEPKQKHHPVVDVTGDGSKVNAVTYWVPTNLGFSSFSVLSFCLFILFMGFSRQEY